MDNLWLKFKATDNRKKHTLHSLGVGFAFFVVLLLLTKIFKTSLCPIKHMLGISCFGCGMTRAFISILKFDFPSAFMYNPLSVPIFIGVAVYSVCAITDVLFDKNYVANIEKQLIKKYMLLIYFALLILLLILKN